MEKKKRNIILEIFICTTIVTAVLIAYLTCAGDNGVFEIRDLEGERSELAAFSFEGTAGDDVHQIHYRWENGELTRKTYPCNEQTVSNLVDANRKGVNPLKKYFHLEADLTQYRNEPILQTAPAEGAESEPLQSWADVPPEIMEDYFERHSYEENPYGNDAFRVLGTKAEAASFFVDLQSMSEVSYHGSGSYTIGVPQGYSRAFTGLTLSDGPYYYLAWEEKEEGGYSDIYSNNICYKGTGFDFLTADTENAVYGILSTNHNVTGEVFLLRFPKEKMQAYDQRRLPEDMPYNSVVYGGAETVAVFDVNEESSILALAACGEDMLLLARTEGGALYLELYDFEGTLIDRENTGIEGILHWEGSYFEGLRRKDSAILGIDITIKENTEDDEMPRYDAKTSDKYLITREGLLRLDDSAHARYTDHKDGKTLLINSVREKETLAMRYTYRDNRTQLSFTVKDEETERTLYRGMLETDFAEDFNKELSRIDISKPADTLEAQKQYKDAPSMVFDEYIRTVSGRILPLDDVSATDNALPGGQYYDTPEYNDYLY